MKAINLLKIAALALTVFMWSCEGPMGPEGPAGAKGDKGDAGAQGLQGEVGPQGEAGADGADGEDGTAGCILCHNNSTDLLAKSIQWSNSNHAEGESSYVRASSGSCAGCHSNEGFHERMMNGTQDFPVTNPTPQTCRTCHKIHTTFTDADWDLTYTANVTDTYWTGETFELGSGNLCANCHQARPVSPMPVSGGDSVSISSYRYGPHHGPQSNLLEGDGGYAFGKTPPTNSAHSIVGNSCIQCHMATPSGTALGGHTFRTIVEDEETGSVSRNTAGCLGCHATETSSTLSALWVTKTEEIAAKMTELHDLLFAAGFLREDGYVTAPAKYHPDDAGAILNYVYMKEDKSHGMHNFKYTNFLLDNAIAHMSAKAAK